MNTRSMRDSGTALATAFLIAGLTLLSASLSACGGDGNAQPSLPITVSVAPSSATVPAGTTQLFNAAVQNDPSQAGVTWTLSPASGAGTLSHATSTSVTYNAPASLPASAVTVTVIATSVAKTSLSATATVMVPSSVVSITPSSGLIPAGTAQVLTATVENDPGQKGVTWSISPASGAGTLSNATSTTVTYSAPASAPASDLAVTITATSISQPAASGQASITVPASIVSLSPAWALVPAGGTQILTAAVQYDPAATGVSWSISPASGAGTLSNATSTTVTYSAPASAPASDVAVTITATSISQPSVSGQASITVPASIVSLSPAWARVPAGSTQDLTATVQYDPGATGVSWSISPASGAGTLTNATATSVTYNAPPNAPSSDLSVSVTATSLTDAAASATATITVPAITVGVAPGSALMPVKSVQTFKATVNDDPANGGVTWGLALGASACPSDCGSVTRIDATTASYSAPSSVPTGPVSLVATSVTDATKSGTASIKVTAGTVQIVPARLDFGQHRKRSSTVEHLTLTNVGAAPLTISGISVSGSSMFTQSNSCGSSVAAAAACDIAVTFKPTGTGSYSATLVITDSSPDSPQQVPLTGRGSKNGSAMATVRLALAAEKHVAAPAPTGPNRVGTRLLSLTDVERDDPFVPGSKRELLVRFWYPAPLSGACRPAPYTEPAVWDYFAELLGQTLPAVRTNSCLDAPVRDGVYPVVVFSHGYTGTFTDYTFLFEDLASRGYIVASVDHTHEATAVAFPDGRLVKSALGSHLNETGRADAETFEAAESIRLRDVRFVVGELTRLGGSAGGPLAGHLDTSSVAVAGHSFGGLTALQAVQQDARIRAAVLIDGVVTERAFELTDKPVLVLDAGRGQWSADQRQLWDMLRGPRFAVNLRASEHIAPTDAVWLAPGAIRTGNMSPEQTVAAVREYVAAFLDAQLLGRFVAPLLIRPSPRFPDADVGGP